jgi:hypothetical protein
MPKVPRFVYIAYRVLEMLVSLVSRFINAAFLGGSTHQTTSARAHIETSRGWRIGRRVINAVFFWQDDHCAWAYAHEVDQARKTLARAAQL